MDNRTIASTIKQAADVKDLAVRYGYTPNRSGFICCPLHNEKTPSLKVERGRWHCFGCGKGGDAIEWVRQVDGLGFSDACRKLDAMYGLGLYGEVHPVIAAALHRKTEKAAQKQAEKEALVKDREEKMGTAFDRYRALEIVLQEQAPATIEDITEEYAHALREISRAAEEYRQAEWAVFDALGITPKPEYYKQYPLQGDPANHLTLRRNSA